MDHDTHGPEATPDPEPADPLTELLRRGARDLIKQAVEAELQAFLDQYCDHTLDDGRRAVVRNGHQPERTVQTGIGNVAVQLPKTRDRSGAGIHFSSNLLPPYLRKTRSVEELLPWLYLKGVSSGDFQEALACLLGESAEGLSASTLGRLKQQWLTEHAEWQARDLTTRRYVYWWADGIHFNLRSEDDDRTCLLVIIGVLPDGTKEFVALDDGMRESTQSWYEMLVRLRDSQGLKTAPRLATGDGALGFWKALAQVYPVTRHQRCWVHKTANVLNKLPKRSQPKAKSALQAIWMAESRDDAERAFDAFTTAWAAKYPKAVETLQKDREELLAFYDFPADHWQSIRTTNPIESTFATVRLRTAKTRGCVTRNTILSLAFKLGQSAEKRWRRLRGYRWLDELERGVTFIDGVAQYEDNNDHRSAA
jgi:transposase-like protein